MFEIVNEFENAIADFFGAPCAVSTDCCTHAIELCLRYKKIKKTTVPNHTYLSIPLTLKKLDISFSFNREQWTEYYKLSNTNIIDAATLWRQNSYIPGTLMCISFQYKKHLSLGRAGMILCDNVVDCANLIKMGYDGRHRNAPWPEQKITSMGYHYYLTPETAQLGLDKLPDAIQRTPKIWSWKDYPDISNNYIFKDIPVS